MARPRSSLYVYFKLPAADTALFQRLSAMQAELAWQTGADARLLHRRDDSLTWMEVYEGIADADAFQAALDAALVRHGIDAASPPRHLEWFVPFDAAPAP
ncbi:DUF4936 family protein [Neisseriaceae bacterium JH1-16]|nr:DUF4936 family protein [Neisseriaceae bacterium JH1-16]